MLETIQGLIFMLYNFMTSYYLELFIVNLLFIIIIQNIVTNNSKQKKIQQKNLDLITMNIFSVIASVIFYIFINLLIIVNTTIFKFGFLYSLAFGMMIANMLFVLYIFVKMFKILLYIMRKFINVDRIIKK